jgi:hypothetical protein
MYRPVPLQSCDSTPKNGSLMNDTMQIRRHFYTSQRGWMVPYKQMKSNTYNPHSFFGICARFHTHSSIFRRALNSLTIQLALFCLSIEKDMKSQQALSFQVPGRCRVRQRGRLPLGLPIYNRRAPAANMPEIVFKSLQWCKGVPKAGTSGSCPEACQDR